MTNTKKHKIGDNDHCPCDSSKPYIKCCKDNGESDEFNEV